MVLFIIVVLAAIAFEYINGFHDAANAIATVVSTKVLTPGFFSEKPQFDYLRITLGPPSPITSETTCAVGNKKTLKSDGSPQNKGISLRQRTTFRHSVIRPFESADRELSRSCKKRSSRHCGA
jgi:hypothetical protein